MKNLFYTFYKSFANGPLKGIRKEEFLRRTNLIIELGLRGINVEKKKAKKGKKKNKKKERSSFVSSCKMRLYFCLVLQ